MRITQSIIDKKLSDVKSATSGKNGTAANQGVLVKDNRVIAYNLETGITAKLPEHTDVPFVLSPKALDMISSLPNSELCITHTGSEVTISTDGITSRFATVPADEFVEPPELSGAGKPVTLDGAVLLDAVSSVLYACSMSGGKPLYTGVLLEASGGTINAVALDGHRAAWHAAHVNGEFKFVVPRASLNSMLKLKMTGDAHIYHSDKSAVFETDDYTVHTRLLSGDFFDYRAAFPPRDRKITVNRKELFDAIGRVLICSDGNKPVIVTFDGLDMVMSTASQQGALTEFITTDGDIDAELRVGFNAKYFRDAVKSYGEGELSLAFGNALEPLIISGGALRSLLLPVRLNHFE